MSSITTLPVDCPWTSAGGAVMIGITMADANKTKTASNVNPRNVDAWIKCWSGPALLNSNDATVPCQYSDDEIALHRACDDGEPEWA